MINNKKHIGFFVLLLASLLAFPQFSEIGKPFIENFSPKDYKHENQNFSITQDTNGIMYFGNLDGVMQFDGEEWRIMDFKGKPRLTNALDGRILVGGYQTFGLIENKSNFKMEYHSLSDEIWKDGYEFDHVNQIKSYNNNTLVLAYPHLFLIDEENRVDCILTTKGKIQLFGDAEPLVLLDSGLYKINFETLDTNRCACNHYKSIENVISFEDKFLVRFIDFSWKVFDKEMNFIRDFNNDASSILLSNRFVSGLYLSNGMFAFGTENCGIIIVNKQGKFITHINQNNGLMDNDVYQLFEDKNHNLWVAMNNGISLLNYPAVFTIFDRDYGVKGGVLDIVRYNSRIYIATSQGLFVSPKGIQTKEDCQVDGFVKVEGIDHKCRRFLKTKGRLFVTNKEGIYELENEKAIKRSDLFAFGMICSKEFKNYLYVASQEGLYVFDLSKGFDLVGKIKNLNKNVRTIAEDIEGNLWLGTNYEGAFFIDMPKVFSLNPKIKQYKEENGLPKDHGWIDVTQTHKGTYFSSYKGVYKFNKQKELFIKQYLIDSVENRWYYPITEDNQGNLWFSSGVGKAYHRQTGLRYYFAQKDSFATVTQPFSKIRDYSLEVIYPDENSVVWFGSFEGLIRFDSKKIDRETEASPTIIRMVKFGEDSIIDPNIRNNKSKIKIPYELNNVFFQVSRTNYQPLDEVLFQYQLLGLNEKWSNWQVSNTEQFLGLKEGKYIFKVRSKNMDGIISEITSFEFIVLPPYYRTWWAYLIYLIVIISFIYTLFRYRAFLYAKEKNELEKVIRDKTEEIVKQKERAEDLVKNILPEDTARELQTKGRVSRKKYDLVTVLFSDIQGFTEIAEHLNPEKLLDEFDQYVLKFDKVVGEYNIEKIKTIGDAYMCAGGIPRKNRTNPVDVVLAGLQMISYAREIQETSQFDWGIRFGVHTGPVIAGVVGSKKMSYDIWGDTVNIASRMESYGEIGHLNISEITYELVAPYFDVEPRGKIPVKYKGKMDMYFVIGLKEEFAKDEKRIIPNRKLELKLQNIRFQSLEDVILTKLEKGLDKRLYYHNVKHTIDVVNQVEVIGLGEGVSEEEMILLKTAALFHDLGHTISYIDHEEQGIIFAKDILPEYNYSLEQIDIISELIYATKFPPEPRNLLEEIICDADLDYLGRADFIPSSNNLYLEMFEHGRIDNKHEWNKIQVSFLKTHQYYTETARKSRGVNKQVQLDKIIEQIEKEESKY